MVQGISEKISELPAVNDVTPGSYVPVVVNGVTSRVDYAIVASGSTPAPYLVATSDISLTGVVVIDGVSSSVALAEGKAVLCTAQSDPINNGYFVPNNAGAWSRPSYYNSDATISAALGKLSGAVLAGTLGTGSSWFQSVGTTLAGAKTWTKLATPSLLQDALSTTLPAQTLTQHKGSAILRDPANGRNTIDYDRVDIREYGANVGGVQRTTATGTAASAAVTLANAKNYINGNWLMLSGLGAAHGMATPAAPTLAVQGTTGASTVSVKVVALTSTGGYTAASAATTVTTANATLSETNFVEVWFAPVASAYRYLVYVQFGGVGNWTYFGGVIAHPQYDDVGRAEAMTFRIISNTPPTATAWLPSTAPAAGQANGLRTQILTGGGTTAITVFPVPITSGAGVNCDACSLIPIEDAINADAAGYASEIRIPRGTAVVTGALQVHRPARLTGSNGGGGQQGSQLLFRDGFGVATFNTTGADQWQPGTLYRIGDRVVSQLRTGIIGCWTLTAIAAGATWGVSGTTEPVWDYTALSTTTDNGHTWTFKQFPGQGSGAGSTFERLKIYGEGETIPANRYAVEDDLRFGAQNLSGLGSAPQVWVANTAVALNAYRVPTAANVNGKMYLATVAGTTHATTEPVWPKVIGATVVDNGVTWTCVDVLRNQGAAFLVGTPTFGKTLAISNFNGTGMLFVGNTAGDGTACTGSDFTDLDVRNITGHVFAAYGEDCQGSSVKKVKTGQRRTGDGRCIVQDNSLYGNHWELVINDGGRRYQNKPWVSSVQRMCKFDDCYVEGVAGSETDVNMPGEVNGGHHASGWRTGATGLRNGVAISVANLSEACDSARLEFDDTGADLMSRKLTGGLERKFWGVGTVAARTLLQEEHASLLAAKGRSQHLVRGNHPVRDTAHFDARGAGEVFPADLRIRSNHIATIGWETRLGVLYAVPTKEVFNAGDLYNWGLDNRRLSIRPARAGGLGAVARAHSTAYNQATVPTGGAPGVAGDIISTSGNHFVCVCSGTSAGSLPAAYATAGIGDYIIDGTAIFQKWTTAQDPNLTAVPNLWADPVAVPDADTTLQYVNVNDGQSCRDFAAITAGRTMTLSSTGMIAGDCFHLRQLNNVAFAITINTVDGGSVVMPANTRCWVVIKMTRAGTFTQHSAGTMM